MTMLYKFLNLIVLLTISSSSLAIQNLDHIIAVVNDDVVTHTELQSRIKDFKHQMSSRDINIPNDDVMKKQVLERIIIDRVQIQLAAAQGMQIDNLTLNRMLEGIAKQNSMTLNELRISLQKENIDFEKFREQTRQDGIIQQLQKRMVYDRISVSAQEIEQFLEQQTASGNNTSEKYHLAHILITTPEAASAKEIKTAQRKASSILDKIHTGEPFRDAALNFSEGQQALNGGDLGWRTAAELPTLFLNAARNLKKGEISQALRSAGGFHIIKLIDKLSEEHIVQQTHVRHILLQSDAITTDQQVRNKMLDLAKKLKDGAAFSALAEEFSQDPGSKNNAGDLGWASKGSFVPKFEKVMDSLEINQISEPFRSQFGWHIVQVLERRQQDETKQLKDNRALQAIKKRKADEKLQLWLRRIRDEAYIEYRDSNKA